MAHLIECGEKKCMVDSSDMLALHIHVFYLHHKTILVLVGKLQNTCNATLLDVSTKAKVIGNSNQQLPATPSPSMTPFHQSQRERLPR